MVNPISLILSTLTVMLLKQTLFGRQCPGMEMLRLLATAAVGPDPTAGGQLTQQGPHIDEGGL